MDIMSILGLVLAIFVILFGILFDSAAGIIPDNLGNFFDPASIAVVLGGVIAGLMISFPLKNFTKIPDRKSVV